MASSRIKKKSSSTSASPLPRQGAIPCLVVIALILIIVGVFLYFSLRSAT